MADSDIPSPQTLPASRRLLITISIMMATVMQTLDSTIANVALPHMAGGLSASQAQINWVLTSYIVASAIGTPLTGWLTARYGRKRLFMVTIAGFTLTSMLCGTATNVAFIVIARLLQGAFGAGLVPLSQSVMLDINPVERRARAMATWGMGVMLGPILGPTLGGWLTDNMNWRWVFFINLPVGVLSLTGVWLFLYDENKPKRTSFDVFGFTTLAVAIGMLQLVLDRGDQVDWFHSIEIPVEAISAFIAFTFFIIHTATAGARSFFNVGLLKDRNFVMGSALYFLMGLLLYATRALVPAMLQTILGYPVVTTGVVTAPSGLGTMIAMLVAGRLVGRVDVRLILVLGFGLTALSLWQMSCYTVQITQWDVVWPGFVQGLGLGFTSVPLTTLTFSTLASVLRPDGTSIYSLSRNLGSSIGISTMQTLITRNTAAMHSVMAADVTAAALMMHPEGYGRVFDLGTQAGLAGLDALLQTQSGFVAYLDDFRLLMWMTIAAVPFLLLTGTRRRSAQTEAMLVQE